MLQVIVAYVQIAIFDDGLRDHKVVGFITGPSEGRKEHVPCQYEMQQGHCADQYGRVFQMQLPACQGDQMGSPADEKIPDQRTGPCEPESEHEIVCGPVVIGRPQRNARQYQQYACTQTVFQPIV